jgi:hypothetical protein
MQEGQATVYFPYPGATNTERTLELAKEVAQREGIRNVIFASTRGQTAMKALEICPEFNLIAVGSYRYRSESSLTQSFEEGGGTRIFAYDDVSYDYPREVQNAYRSFGGEGAKVVMEVVLSAVLAGLVPEGEKVIGIGGTYPGADTAFVVIAAGSFGQLRVTQIICTPSLER